LTDLPPRKAYEDVGTGNGINIITDFDKEADKLLFLSNELFSKDGLDFGYVAATSMEAEDGYTWITYKAEPDFFGALEVRILNQELSKEAL